MIEIKNLNKYFGQKWILKNINLSVAKNEIIAIIGPSGAGKSTLLRTINMLEVPQSGEITIDNFHFDYKNHKKDSILLLRQKSAMVFQSHNLFINKSVLENVSEGLIIAQKLAKIEAQNQAKFFLEQVGLSDKINSYPHELSGGQAQRVGIARALALNRNVILFDEPTSSLDLELVGEVLTCIKNIQNKTMLIVTHELKFAHKIANRIIFMSEGEILESAPPDELFNRPKHERVRKFIAKMSEF